MPRVPVYSVDFSNGNLTPSLDANSWGAMKLGNSGTAQNPTSTADTQGLNLAVTAAGTPAAIGGYVVFDQGVLSLESRLLLQLEFDRPDGIPPVAPATGFPEPWAMAVNVKAGNESFVPNEPMVVTTCQFNRQFNGVRLNTPGHLEGDQATVCVTPLDYSSLTPGRFTLEMYFCGLKAAGRYSTGFSTLVIGPPIRTEDQRVFSNAGLSNISPQTWIGALGATLVTLNGRGQIKVRLRTFSVSAWT